MLSQPSKSKHSPSFPDCSVSVSKCQRKTLCLISGVPWRSLAERRWHWHKGTRKNKRKTGLERDFEEALITVNTICPKNEVRKSSPLCFQNLIWKSVRWDGSFGSRDAWSEEGDTRTRQITSIFFWSLFVLRSKFIAVCQYTPVGIGSSVPAGGSGGLQRFTSFTLLKNSSHLLYTC